jgi:hypothetical protein
MTNEHPERDRDLAHDAEYVERDPDYARGEDEPLEHPEDEHKGRYSTGEEDLPETDPEKTEHGRFSEGQEDLPDSDPEKHVERRFSEGQDDTPPEVKP